MNGLTKQEILSPIWWTGVRDPGSEKSILRTSFFFGPFSTPLRGSPAPAGWFRGPSKDVIDNHARTQARSRGGRRFPCWL